MLTEGILRKKLLFHNDEIREQTIRTPGNGTAGNQKEKVKTKGKDPGGE